MKTRRGVHHGFTWLYALALSLLAVTPALAAQLTLTWTDNAADELGFRVERRLSPSGTYSEITTVGPNVTSYADTGVTAGQGYCYQVRAYNSAGSSAYSNEACGTASAGTTVTLTVTKAGSGSGTVTSTTPANAISCGADCAETVASGTAITLTASPGSGSVFSGWSGGGCSGTGGCTTPMTATATVTATFNTASAPPGGLVAAYSFDEGTGSTTSDASGQGNTGTISEATWTTQGRFGGALSFDGVNDYVTLGNPVALQLTGSMTVSAWINSGAFPVDDAAIVSKRASGQLGMQLDTTVDQGARAIGFKLTNASGGSMFRYGATTLQLNTWYHIAGVYNGASQTLDVYLNGQLDNGTLVGTITSSQQDSTQNVHIGQRPGTPGTYNFSGRIDEVRVHNRALSASEISALVTTGIGGGTTPPPSYTLTAAKSGAGSGTVTGLQGATTVIACGSDCTETVPSGTVIALSASPATGSVFTGWSGGGCTGTAGCSVTVSAATTVTAAFTPTMTLTAAKSGAGSGTVTGLQGATTVIACGSDCTETVPSGTVIALSASPATGSVFTGWSGGGCTGTAGCSVTVSAATTVTAAFTPTMTLTAAKSGAGSGTVTGLQGATTVIACGSDCTETVPSGTVIALSASPATGSVFSGWSGGGCTGTGGCSVTVSAATTVTAAFTPTMTLTAAKSGAGSGTVTGLQGATTVIACGSDCTETVPSGTVIALSASPATGSVFTGWSGGGCTGTGSCSVTVSAATTVTAAFTPTVTLTVAKSGAGTVTSTAPSASPALIDCGSDCTQTVTAGTAITLSAAPAAGSAFTGWSGGGCSGSGTCVTPMTATATVTATFAPTVTLTVAKSGAGTVTSTAPSASPALIDCGSDCTQTVTAGTAITLSAAPAAGSAFTGWSGGGCAGSGTCVTPMTATATVTATFAPTVTLTVAKSGAGAGTVTSTAPSASPALIDCGSDCTQTVTAGTAITLSAAPAAGSAFTGWSGGGCAGSGTCVTPMTATATVTATFAPTVTLTVAKSGAGAGTVTSTAPSASPALIDCGSDCTQTVTAGTAITLSAAPAAGSAFTGWSGGGCAGSGTCVTPMTATATVTATFAPTVTLTVAKSGAGAGTVTSTAPSASPALIDCGSDCTQTVTAGTAITLSAAPAAGSAFTGWSGGGCAGSGTCVTPMTASATVTATFATTVTLTVAKTGAGAGTVTSTAPSASPALIDCGSDCTQTVTAGTAITLSAAPAAGSAFTGWSGGGCSGSGTCVTPMTATATVTATFGVIPGAIVQFSVANYSVSESGGTATITVVRSVTTNTQVQVHYRTDDGSALAGTDYTQAEGDLVFSPGQTSKTFQVPVTKNTIVDGSRIVLLQLSDPQGAQLGSQQTAVLTIQDDDGGGAFTFSATGYSYPDKQGYATITVTRSGGSAGGVSVKYRTGTAGTAVAGVDYTPITTPGMLTFGPSETSKTFTVGSLGNSVAGDPSKTVQLLLSDPAGGATLGTPNAATLTLTNDDAGGGVKFAASSYSVPENSSVGTLTVTRSGGVASGVSVQIAAVDGSAKAGVDYGSPAPSTLTFAANETSKTVDVPLIPNPLAASSRSLTVKLQNPSGGGTLSSPTSATLTLTKVGIRFSQPAYTVNEGPSTATITVNRLGTAKDVTVQVQTLNDSAVAPADYTAINQTLTFSKNETSKTLSVTIPNNPNKSTNRALRLRLLNAVGEPLGEPHESTLLILDKDRAELQFAAFAPPATGLVGKTISVPNTVRNLSARSAPSSSVKFVLSGGGAPDVTLGTRSVGTLGAGASSSTTTTLTIPSGTTPGPYTLVASLVLTDMALEQNTADNAVSAPLTIVSNVVRTFGVSGIVTNDGCTSPPRNGRAVALGSVAFASQAGSAVTGTLTLTFPLVPGLQTSGPIQATVDTDGHVAGTFAYTTKQGSTTLSSGAGTLTGTANGATLEVDLTGQSASGETCDFTGWLAAPATPIGFMGFHHDTTVGPLEALDGALVASPAFPASLARYRVLFQVAGDTAFPAPSSVLFTGPAGSQLSDTPGAERAQLATNTAEYRSPWVTSPPTAPAGAWTEEYKGNYYDYTEADPQAASRLVVPVPSFVLASGQITRVDWAYRGATGSALSGPPAFMRQIRIQLLDPCGLVLHDSLALDPATTARILSSAVELGKVAEARFQYVDDWDNVFTVRYGATDPSSCKMVEFSAPSYSAGENVKTASITVRRVGDLSGTVTVNFTTSNGTAQDGQDYTNASQPVSLGPNVSSKVIGVPILDNGTPQNPRTVLLGLSGPAGGATLGPLRTAVLTINDDDPRVRFSSATYTVSEGSSTATITVQRTGATTPVVSVPYATADGTALAGIGLDYTATAGVLTFASGQTSKTFTVPILNDTLAEGGQTVNLTLGTPTGAWLATPSTAVLTITDNDTGGTLAFAATSFSVAEDGGAATITVLRTGGTGGGVTVQYATSNGTGLAGTDYDARSGTLTFGVNETSKTFTVPVHVNPASTSKSVVLTLSNPSPGAALGAPTTAILWIVDTN